MIVITGERQTGKTTELIKRAAENQGIIACFNHAHVNWYVNRYIPEMVEKGAIPKKHGILVTTLNELLNGMPICRHGEKRNVFIDDLDVALSEMLFSKNLNLNTVVIGNKEYTEWHECNFKGGLNKVYAAANTLKEFCESYNSVACAGCPFNGKYGCELCVIPAGLKRYEVESMKSSIMEQGE